MIWVTGCLGMLGRQVCRALRDAGIAWRGTDRDVDISDEQAVAQFCRSFPAEWIINCAAYTAVDRAEAEQHEAMRVNADGPAALAKAARNIDARLIHFSTDYVFDGALTRPYREDDEPAPLSAYGRSKLLGEEAVANLCERYYIFRLSWLYGVFGGGFPGRVVRLLRAQPSVEVVDDQTASPTACAPLARFLAQLVARDPAAYGLYHYCDRGAVSRFGLACAAAEEAERRGIIPSGRTVLPVTTEQYARRAGLPCAARPSFSCLDTRRAEERLGCVFSPWRENLSAFFDEWQQEARDDL